MPQVKKVMRISAPFKFVSREFKRNKIADRSQRSGDWRRRVRDDGWPMLRRKRKADFDTRSVDG